MTARVAVALCGLLTLMVSSSLAQGVQSKITGKVVDPNHAAVRGADVLIDTEGRARAGTATTNEGGEFSVALAPGKYLLHVTASGFAESSLPVDVTPSAPPVEIVLDVAGSIASVTVTDSGGYQIGAISSATKTYTNLRDIPQSISVVSGEQIRDRSLDSVAAA